MKKIIFIVSIGLFSLASEAQGTLQGGNTLVFRKSPDFDDTAIAGSRYLSENFKTAKVNKGTEDFLIRYNAYGDIMEYKNIDETLELIKEKNTFFNFADGTIYELLTYKIDNKNFQRYHQILSDNGLVKVSKFQSIKLNPARQASNSYEKDSQASYSQNRDTYFITINGVTHPFDGKRRSLEKLFPNNVNAIKEFYKKNQIKENDTDMIVLGQYLNNL